MNSSVHFDTRIVMGMSCEAVGTGWNAASGHTQLSSDYSKSVEKERKKKKKEKKSLGIWKLGWLTEALSVWKGVRD